MVVPLVRSYIARGACTHVMPCSRSVGRLFHGLRGSWLPFMTSIGLGSGRAARVEKSGRSGMGSKGVVRDGGVTALSCAGNKTVVPCRKGAYDEWICSSYGSSGG